jgi:hypothetical protein
MQALAGAVALHPRCRAARGEGARRTRAAAAAGRGDQSAGVSDRVASALRGTNVFVVGDNAGANAKLCDALATSLGCACAMPHPGTRRSRAANGCG